MKTWIYSVLVGFILLAALPAKSQDVFYSKEQKFTLKDGDFSVVGWCGDRLYTYRASKEGYYLDAYNDSMRLLATVALDFFPQKIYETQFYANEKGITVLYQAIQHNEVIQYAARLDDKARIVQKPKALDSVKIAWFGENKKYYSSEASQDRNKFMIYSVGKRKNKKVTINTILFDNELNLIAKGSPFINANDNVNFVQALLTKDGTFYMAGNPDNDYRHYNEDSWIFKLSPNGQQFDAIAMPLDGSYASPVYMQLNDQTNDVYVAAYYSDGQSGNNLGVVYGMLSPLALEFSTFKKIPFDADLINVSDERNKKKAFNDYDVKRIIVKNDGGFILIGENYFIDTRTYGYGTGMGYYNYYNSGFNNGTTVREYHYGDVMVLDYDKDGNRLWHNFIRKDQNSTDDGGMFSSYALLNSGATLVFLYNDYSSSKSTLSLAAVDVDGALQMKRMNPGRLANADWLPRSGKQIDVKEMLIPVLRKDNLSFVRVAF